MHQKATSVTRECPFYWLVKDHLLESSKRYLRMSVDVIKDKDEGEVDFRGQNNEEMRCIDVIVKQAVE